MKLKEREKREKDDLRIDKKLRAMSPLLIDNEVRITITRYRLSHTVIASIKSILRTTVGGYKPKLVIKIIAIIITHSTSKTRNQK
jgi:hypothetical protein